MAANSDPRPPSTTAAPAAAAGTLEEAYLLWTSHFYFCLAVVFLCRLVGALLPIVLSFLVNHLLPSARAYRSTCQRIEREIRDIQLQMLRLNWKRKHTAFSKLVLKYVILEIALLSLEVNLKHISDVTGMVAETLRLVLNGLMIARLVFNWPPTDLAQDQLAKASAQRIYGLPIGFLVSLVHYVPNRVLSLLWIALCAAATSAPIAWVTARLT